MVSSVVNLVRSFRLSQQQKPPEVIESGQILDQFVRQNDVGRLRDFVSPPEKRDFIDRIKIALGIGEFESALHEAESFLEDLQNGKEPKQIPLILLTDSRGNTPLHWAIKHSRYDIASELIKRMTVEQLSAANDGGVTALHAAASKETDFLLRQLLELVHLDQLGIQDKNGQTPLHWAAYGDRIEPIMLLLPLVDPELLIVQDNLGRTPLVLAADRKNHCAVQLFIHAMSSEQILISDKLRYTVINYLQINRQNKLIDAVLKKPNAKLLLAVRPHRLMPADAALLLGLEFVHRTSDNSATLVNAVRQNLESKQVAEEVFTELMQRYVFDLLSSNQREYLEGQFLTDLSLKIIYLMTCMGVLVPQRDKYPEPLKILQYIKYHHVPSKNSLAEIWEGYPGISIPEPIDPERRLTEEDVRVAGTLLRGGEASTALSILRESGQWTLAQAERLLNHIVNLDPLD